MSVLTTASCAASGCIELLQFPPPDPMTSRLWYLLSPPDQMVVHPSIYKLSVKNSYLRRFLHASSIRRTAGDAKRSTAGSAYDTEVNPGSFFTAGSYAGRWWNVASPPVNRPGGPPGRGPAVIRITAGCLIIVVNVPAVIILSVVVVASSQEDVFSR